MTPGCAGRTRVVARQALAAASGEKVEITAVLKEGTSRLSIGSFANFSIPVVCTEADVVGRIVRIREVAPQTWTQGTAFSNGGTLVERLPELYTAFRERLVNRTPGGPEKIFVSRKSSRTIENEDEITAILKSHGFERYYFETGELTVRSTSSAPPATRARRACTSRSAATG